MRPRQGPLYPSGGHSIEIDAGMAFGTGHHGTTCGCLMALSSVLKRTRPSKVLDVGCGPGASAFVMAEALPQADILGVDIAGRMIQRAVRNHRKHYPEHTRRPLHVSLIFHFPAGHLQVQNGKRGLLIQELAGQTDKNGKTTSANTSLEFIGGSVFRPAVREKDFRTEAAISV